LRIGSTSGPSHTVRITPYESELRPPLQPWAAGIELLRWLAIRHADVAVEAPQQG